MSLHTFNAIRHDGRSIADAATRGRYLDPTEVAKVARKRLGAAFPGVTFRVRSSKYAGGASVDVRWTDGPTVPMVDAVVGGLHGSTFDGMTDCKHSIGAQYWPEFDEPVRAGNDFIFTNRELSPAFTVALRNRICRRYSTETMRPYELDTLVYRLSGRATMQGHHLIIRRDEVGA